MRARLGLVEATVIGILISLAGCGGSRPNQAKPAASAGRSVILNGAGASFPYPLYSRWIAEYAKVDPQVRINYQSIGSGGGIQQLKARTVDFGASDAPLSDAEIKEMSAPVLHLPATAGAVAVVYNLPELTTPLRLSGPVLAAIFLGQITKWNDAQIASLNPGTVLPGSPIAVAHRSDGSGTSYIFTTYLAAVSDAWKTKVGAGKSVNWPVGIGAKGNEGVTGVVKQTPGSLGYVELAYAEQNSLSSAQIQNAAAQFVAPSPAGVTAAAAGAAAAMHKDVRAAIVNAPNPAAYPISGFSYLLVYRDQKDAARGRALGAFLDWAIHQGQSSAQALSYASLPPEVVKLDESSLQKITIAGEAMKP